MPIEPKIYTNLQKYVNLDNKHIPEPITRLLLLHIKNEYPGTMLVLRKK